MQCSVDKHKAELYIRIIKIIADNSERHVYVFCVVAESSSSAFVTDAGNIVLQVPRNRNRVTKKDK